MNKVEARKLDMTQIFTEDGMVHPVTVVSFEEFPTDLTPGTDVKIVGKSKGKGFSGVMKRHGFKGMPATHGRSTKGRAPGSIGGTTTPGRVYRGKRMAGRMGGERITIKGLAVLEIDPEGKTAKILGPLPGSRLSRIWLEYEPQEVPSPAPEAENQPVETAEGAAPAVPQETAPAEAPAAPEAEGKKSEEVKEEIKEEEKK